MRPLPRGLNHLLAVDPGGTTGMCSWIRMTDDSPSYVEHGYWDAWNAETAQQVYLAIKERNPDLVLLERFASGQRFNEHYIYTVEVIGGVKAVCAIHEPPIPVLMVSPQHKGADKGPYMLQAAAMLTERVRLQRLAEGKTKKQRGRGFTDHQIDSIAHILSFLRTGK